MKRYKFERIYKKNKFTPYTFESDNPYEIMQKFIESQQCPARDLKGVKYLITIQTNPKGE